MIYTKVGSKETIFLKDFELEQHIINFDQTQVILKNKLIDLLFLLISC